MTYQQLVCFIEVKKTLNFTKAAQNLHVTQSALSYSIVSLEKDLGVPLFVRQSGQGIRLTSYGRSLYPMAENAIRAMQEIGQAVEKIRNPFTGVVSIAFSYVNCWQFMPGMLQSFRRDPAAEDITIRLDVNHSRKAFEDLVLSGDVDLAVSCMQQKSGLHMEQIARQQLYVAVAPDHPLAERQRVTVKDITEEKLIVYHQGGNLDRWIREMFSRQGLHPSVEEYTEEWYDQLIKVGVGDGIAVMQRVPCEEDLVRFIPLEDEMALRPVNLMWAQGRDRSPAARYLSEFLLGYSRDLPIM